MERTPYYSIEAEEAIIGALFLDGELIKDYSVTSKFWIIPESISYYSPKIIRNVDIIKL